MRITFITFGLKYNHGEHLDLQIDTRMLPNPYYIKELASKNGLDEDVYDYVVNSEMGQEFCKHIVPYLEYYFEKISFHDEIRVGICCTGGQHRSVAISQYLKKQFEDKYEIDVIHQESEKWA